MLSERENVSGSYEDSFKIGLGRAYVPILKALGEVSFPYQMAKISKLTGLQEHICRQRITNLMRYGWRFTVHVNELRLGLKRLILVLKRKPDKILADYLRSASRIVASSKYVFSYYLPISHDPLDIINYYSDLVEEYYIIMNFERTRPEGILRYYNYRDEIINVKYQEILNILLDNYAGEIVTINKVSKSAFGGIDLILLKELQKNPFLTYRELSDRTKLTYSRILRRMKLLVREGVLGSIRIMRIPRIYHFVSTVIINGIKPYRELIEKLTSIPYVAAVGFNEKTMFVILRLPWFATSVLSDISELLGTAYEVRTYIMDPKLIKTYTIPYRHEYSKYEGWVFKVSSASSE